MRPLKKETPGQQVAGKVNAALIVQTGVCVLGLTEYDAIAKLIDEEIARHAKALLENEPDILPETKETEEDYD